MYIKPAKARPSLLSWGAIAAVLFFLGSGTGVRAVTVLTDIDGQLVKGSGPEVFFQGSDGKRYSFPNEKIFYSWYKDFSTVKTVSESDLAAVPVAGTVTYKPGARLVKIPSDAKVYAVTGDGVLRWVSSEDVAKQIFGEAWAKQVDDVSGSMFSSYQLGDPIAASSDYSVTGQDQPTTQPTQPPAADKFTVSVEVAKTDSKGNSAEDIRSFKLAFNKAYTGGRLTISEKSSGAAFYSEPLPAPAAGAKAVTVWPDAWRSTLKPSTAYAWKVVAYSAANATADQTAAAAGDFTTTDFSSSTAAPGTSSFKITSVRVDKLDAQGQAAEDVRSFHVIFTAAARGVKLTITEKSASEPAVSQLYASGAVTPLEIDFKPGDWPAKLKPSTAYAWKIVAYASGGTTYLYDVASGDFTTSAFTPAASADSGSSAPATTAAAFSFCPTGDGSSEGCCASSGSSFAQASQPLSPGTLIRGTSSPMVYYYASNGKRYVMTGKDVMISWFETGDNLVNGTSSMCRNVRQLSDADLSGIAIGGNVGIRPGTYLVKVASDSKIYVIARNKTIRQLASAAMAEQIFPGSSSKRIRVVPDAFFSGYKIGEAITDPSAYNPAAEYDWASPNTMERELGTISAAMQM